MKTDWYIGITEWTQRGEGLPIHKARLAFVVGDFDTAYEAAQRAVKDDTEVRLYIYHWERNGGLEYCGVYSGGMSLHKVLNYGRLHGIGLGDALLEAASIIWGFERPRAEADELVGELCTGDDGKPRCVTGCGTPVTKMGDACVHCLRDAGCRAAD